MKTIARWATYFAVAFGLGAAARADTFDYSYTFGGGVSSGGAGSTVQGAFDGTLNGNLITNISNASVVFNGVSLGGIIYVEGSTNTGFVDGVAVVSLDGTQNNFLFANSDIAAGDNTYTGYLYSKTGNSVVQGHDFIQYGDPVLYAYDFNPVFSGINSSWTVTDVSVPDGGSTIALLGGVLGGLAVLRRRFAR